MLCPLSSEWYNGMPRKSRKSDIIWSSYLAGLEEQTCEGTLRDAAVGLWLHVGRDSLGRDCIEEIGCRWWNVTVE